MKLKGNLFLRDFFNLIVRRKKTSICIKFTKESKKKSGLRVTRKKTMNSEMRLVMLLS